MKPDTDKTLMVVDSNYLCHQAKHAYKSLSLNGAKTAVIFGFMKKIIKVSSVVKPTDIAFVWDSPSKHCLRRKLYPEYKMGREAKYVEDPEEKLLNEICFPQFWVLKDEVLPSLGFHNILSADGYEGDDIMAELALRYDTGFVALVTGDNDLLQMVRDGKCAIFHPKHNEYITERDVFENYGINPEYFGMMKCLSGCDTDKVPGIPQIGEKRAVAYINGVLKETTIWFKRIEESGDIIERNFKLVVLPFDDGLRTMEMEKNSPNLKKYADVCAKYDMKSLLSNANIDAWEKILSCLKG